MLIRENNEAAQCTWVYTYPEDGDENVTSGNILSRKTYEYTTAATPANLISTDTFTYGSSAWGDLLTGYGGKTITYSGVRPVTYGDYSLSWYRGGLLSGFSKTGDTNTYTYDVSGRRLTKAHNGTTTTFIYAGDLLVGQKTGNDALTFKFDSAGNYFGFTYDGEDYYYVKNLQSDVTAITNSTGSIVVEYGYDAWGRLLSTTGTAAATIGAVNPIRYRSYYYDTESGFYFLQSRYYEPECCRFITADESEVISATPMDLTDKSLFAYCDNNPVARIDDEGEFWKYVAYAGITIALLGLTIATAGIATPLIATTIGVAVSASATTLITSGFAIAFTGLGMATTACVGQVITDITVYSRTYDPDPYARPGQKKQGRERKSKARQNKNWKPRSKPKPLKKHTPSKVHRKEKYYALVEDRFMEK